MTTTEAAPVVEAIEDAPTDNDAAATVGSGEPVGPSLDGTDGPAGDDDTDHFARWLLLITLAALALRVAFVLIGQRDVPVGGGDSFYYHRGAELLVEGHGFVAPHQWDEGIKMQAASHPPVYLLYLAFFTAIGAGTPVWHMLASCLLGAGAVAFVGLVGKRLGGPRVGLIAAAIAAVYPQMWVNDGMLMSESAAVFFGMLALLCCYRFSEQRSHRRAFVMGLAIALAALSRSELILLAPLVAVPLCLAARGDRWRPRLEKLVLAGVGSLLLVGPWVGFNLSRFDHPVYLSAGLEITQAVSNCDDTYSGQYLGYWSYNCQIPIDQAAIARGLDKNEESERSLYMGEAARAYVSEHRSEVPKVVAARLGRILGVFRPTQQLEFDSFTEARPRWAAELAAWGYWILAPLAVAGGVIARRRRDLLYPLLAVIATVLFAVVLTFAGTRYRAPAEPILAILAAVFLAQAIPRRRPIDAGGTLALTSTGAPVATTAVGPVAADRAAPVAPIDREPTGAVTVADGALPATGDGKDPDDATAPSATAAGADRHLPNLDGLRALAAIAVLTAHVAIASGVVRSDRTSSPLRPLLPRLDVGVAVFFVLSGFLLFRPFARALIARRSGPGVRSYLVRRALRIYPLYWVVLALQIALNQAQNLDPDRFSSVPGAVSILSYASLFHIYRNDTAIGPIGQAWSLGTEVSFYLFLPAFAAGMALVLRRVDAERSRTRLLAAALGGLVVVATATKLWLAATTDPDNTTTRGLVTTWLPFNLDLFAAGMALALASIWWERHPDRRPAWLSSRVLPGASWAVAAVAFVVVSTQLDLRPDHFNYTDSQLLTRQTLYGLVGIFLLLPAVFGPQDQGWIRRFLSTPVMVALGLASYGIYLWHQLLGAEYYKLLQHQLFNTAFVPAYGAILVASIAASLLTYRVIEEPAQRLKDRLGVKR